MTSKVLRSVTPRVAILVVVIVLVGIGGYLLGAHTSTQQTPLDNAEKQNEYVPIAVLDAYNALPQSGALDKCYKLTGGGYDYTHPVYILSPSAHRASLVVTQYYYDAQGKSLGEEVRSDVSSENKPAPIDVKNYDCYRLKDPGPLFSTE